jgi:hypothetical protein
LYLSTLGNSNPPGAGGTGDDADIYNWDDVAFSRVFDARVGTTGLPGGADVDALAYVAADDFFVSFNAANTNLPGLGNVQDEDVVHYDGTDWSMYFDGTAQGMTSGGHDIDAISIVDGVMYFSTLGNSSIPGLAGPFDDADIYSWDGTIFGKAWDARDNGVPGSKDIDGLAWVSATDFNMSLTNGWNFPGTGGSQDEDVVHYDGTAWSVYFDGTAHGLGGVGGLDLDAIDVPVTP